MDISHPEMLFQKHQLLREVMKIVQRVYINQVPVIRLKRTQETHSRPLHLSMA